MSTSSRAPRPMTAATTYFNILHSTKYTHSLTAIVSNTVENYLGDVSTWLSYIITYLFAETSSPRVVEELTAFFAGNGVPKTLAYKLYRACNKQNLCGNYSTRGFPCGTLQTPFDVTPCIMTYASRNMYAFMYRTSLSSSPLEKNL